MLSRPTKRRLPSRVDTKTALYYTRDFPRVEEAHRHVDEFGSELAPPRIAAATDTQTLTEGGSVKSGENRERGNDKDGQRG
jgi:hypothetical protein